MCVDGITLEPLRFSLLDGNVNGDGCVCQEIVFSTNAVANLGHDLVTARGQHLCIGGALHNRDGLGLRLRVLSDRHERDAAASNETGNRPAAASKAIINAAHLLSAIAVQGGGTSAPIRFHTAAAATPRATAAQALWYLEEKSLDATQASTLAAQVVHIDHIDGVGSLLSLHNLGLRNVGSLALLLNLCHLLIQLLLLSVTTVAANDAAQSQHAGDSLTTQTTPVITAEALVLTVRIQRVRAAAAVALLTTAKNRRLARGCEASWDFKVEAKQTAVASSCCV